jgi:hypothetical protein
MSTTISRTVNTIPAPVLPSATPPPLPVSAQQIAGATGLDVADSVDSIPSTSAENKQSSESIESPQMPDFSSLENVQALQKEARPHTKVRVKAHMSRTSKKRGDG